MAWHRKSRNNQESQKKKRRKSGKAEETSKDAADPERISPTDLLALGTIAGSVFIYSMMKGDLQSKLNGGHDDTVNDVCWHPSEDSLYSCSDDRHVVEWDVTNRIVRSKWKADKTSVHSLCVCPGGETLLTAGRTIQLWNLHTKAVLKKFTGHASPVTRLRILPQLGGKTNAREDPLCSVEGLYFLSSAVSDRILNVWQIKSDSKDKTSLASFAVPDEPVDFDICVTSDSVVYASVVTQTGQVLVFDMVLNGKTKKPFHPKHVLNVTSEGSRESPPKPIPVLTTHLNASDAEPQLLLAYGTFLKPAFENLALQSQEKEICLIREDHFQKSKEPAGAGDKVKRPSTSDDVAVLGPNNMAPSKPVQSSEEPAKSGKKRNKRKSLRTELSMEDRLNALSIAKAKPTTDTTQPPRIDVMVTLLSQGLQSQDRELLDRVLQQDKPKIITNTIQQLPVPLIVPLVQELASRMNTAPQNGLIIAHWTRVVLRERASYLMTCPELMLRLSHMYETINTRTSSGHKLSRLHGKLDLMLAQISSQQQTGQESQNGQAMVTYEDDSSDEVDLMEEGLVIHSESEGDWDEFSDSDMEVPNEDHQQNASDAHSDSDGGDMIPDDDDTDDDDDDENLSSHNDDSEEDEDV